MNNFKLEIYRQCMEQRKHYDNLSWTIGGAVVVIIGFILSSSKEQAGSIAGLLAICSLNFVGIIMVYLWRSVYHRNRLFVEVSNELCRDIEREHNVEGLGLRNGKFGYGKSAGAIHFKNLDINNEKYADKSEEVSRVKSTHIYIGIIHALLIVIHSGIIIVQSVAYFFQRLA